jgi:hypothetical protein
MGNPNPTDWPVFEPTKYYRIFTKFYGDWPPPYSCDESFLGNCSDCPTGSILNYFFTHNSECAGTVCICPAAGWYATRILSAIGPFDTIEKCYG